MDKIAVTFGRYITMLAKVTFSSSLALGLIFGVLVLVTGGAEGEISLDIDFSATDSIWFLLGTPALVSAIFLLISPLSFFIHAAVFRKNPVKSSDDV